MRQKKSKKYLKRGVHCLLENHQFLYFLPVRIFKSFRNQEGNYLVNYFYDF